MQPIQTNTLVKHKKLSSLGIGCVAKTVSKTKVKVNFGKEDVITCSPNLLIPVDTSKCKTIKFSELKTQSITNTVKKKNNIVIIGNEVKQDVGIGWVCLSVVTEEDLKKYPRVID